MNNTTSDILLALIRSGLNCDITTSGNRYDKCDLFSHPITEQTWYSVYKLSVAQGVLAIAWDGLQRISNDGITPILQQLPISLKLQWAYNVERSEAHYAKQRTLTGHLAAFYNAHDIPMMILKGYGLSLYYPIPEHRQYGDIDIWLYGRQQEADNLLHREKGIAIDEDKHHHTTFVINGIMIENHYDFINIHSHRSNWEIEQHLQELAEQGGEYTEVDGEKIMLPTPDFNALFLLRHAAMHFSAVDIGLRNVIDWALFVRRYHEQIDWITLEQIVRKQNMHRFMYCMDAIAIDHLGISAAFFPSFQRDAYLESRVLNEILNPEFSEQTPANTGLLHRIYFKARRWWANRWKHRIVYREGLIRSFISQSWSHLLKPKSLK